MKIIISPAKSLNLDKLSPTNEFSEGFFLKESNRIAHILKKKNIKELTELMGISQNIAEINWQRNQNWELPFTFENAKQAIFMFDGAVYNGLDVYSLPMKKIKILQDKVRILSGLYGLIKPLDLIQAYRLEMGTKIEIGINKNLYEFWKSKITKQLNNELEKNELFINLASHEYAAAVDFKILKVPIINVVFKEYRNENLTTIGFFAKKARGLMVRYILDHDCETIQDLMGFDYENYKFNDSLSQKNHLVFVR